MNRTVNIHISGRVQGVYFRRFTKNKAQDLGVKGTVRNREDGRVEIVAQAEVGILEPFIQWCHKGPITARVDQVEITEVESDENVFSSFEIL
jgi:acylphosphatase